MAPGRGWCGRDHGRRGRRSERERSPVVRTVRPPAFTLFAAILLVLAAARSAAAQEEQVNPLDATRFRFGPLGLTPSISVTNLGTDSNVNNDPDHPESATTGAVGPAVNFAFKAGRSYLTGTASGQYLFYSGGGDLRAWNTTNSGRWELPMARITPFLTGGYNNNRNRFGYEIDIRARQRIESAGAGLDMRVSNRTNLVVSGQRSRLDYDRNDVYQGVSLSDALDHETTTAELQLRYRLTPLTTFVVRNMAMQDRFTFSDVRNANSYAVVPGFELKPLALISGSVFVGAKRFDAVDSRVTDYQGVVASVDAKYALASTQFAIKVGRDISFSYDARQPYYVLTDSSVSATERLSHSWDVVGRLGLQRLAYRGFNGATTSDGRLEAAPVGNRVDTGHMYGGGIGFRAGQNLRIGFDAMYYQRTSELTSRDYDGLRFGASFTYGLAQ